VELFATRVVERPAGEVADFFFDAANNPRWQNGMRRCEWITPGPIAVGSTYLQEASFMGRTISSRFEVTEHTPGRSITIRTIESTFPIEVTRTVDSIDPASCRVTARISGGPGGVFRLFSPVIRRIAQRSVDRDYDRLVVLLTA
jgi:hypothetical protein